MTDTIWFNIANTPWWVYVLLLYFIRISLLATKPHVISLKTLYFFPAIFLIFSLPMLCFSFHFTFLHFLVWVGGITLGSFYGYLQFRFFKIKAIKNKAQLYVPGSWNVMVIMILLVAAKIYFSADISAFNFSLVTQPSFTPWLFLLHGFSTGFFIGRLVYSFRCLKVGPYFTEN